MPVGQTLLCAHCQTAQGDLETVKVMERRAPVSHQYRNRESEWYQQMKFHHELRFRGQEGV